LAEGDLTQRLLQLGKHTRGTKINTNPISEIDIRSAVLFIYLGRGRHVFAFLCAQIAANVDGVFLARIADTLTFPT
jgi:hypothetical protein